MGYKAQLISQLEETKKVADEEAKERHSLLGKFKNLEHEVDGAKEQLDEEVGLKEDTLRQLNKACQESDMWRQKYESEGLAEKEEEFQSTKKNFTKAVDGMQSALESESKGEAEALRMKKKLESDVSELDTSLEHANAANVETQKSIKVYNAKIREAQAALEDEQRAKEVCRDQLIAAERKAHSTQNALEEARTLLEQADRARRIVEQELSDTNETLSELI